MEGLIFKGQNMAAEKERLRAVYAFLTTPELVDPEAVILTNNGGLKHITGDSVKSFQQFLKMFLRNRGPVQCIAGIDSLDRERLQLLMLPDEAADEGGLRRERSIFFVVHEKSIEGDRAVAIDKIYKRYQEVRSEE